MKTNQDILNFKPPMEYRRFGKTERRISVITLGGMRFKHGWDDPIDEIPEDSLEECVNTVKSAMNCGINHIETAFGYKKSENLYGLALNRELNIPRSHYYLMTKSGPKDYNEMLKRVEEQLKALRTPAVGEASGGPRSRWRSWLPLLWGTPSPHGAGPRRTRRI